MISKELFNKIRNIIDSLDYAAHKEWAYHGLSSKKSGNEKRSYSLNKTDNIIAYLLSLLNEKEKEEMKNFTNNDLSKILNRNEKYRMYGIQISMDIQKESNKKKGRWGL